MDIRCIKRSIKALLVSVGAALLLMACVPGLSGDDPELSGIDPGPNMPRPVDPPVEPGNQPPVFDTTSAPPAAARTNVPYIYQATATDPDGDSVSYALTLAPAGMTVTANGLVKWPLPAPALGGARSVALTASDGQTSAMLEWTVAIEGTPAFAANPAPAAIAPAGTRYAYQAIAADPDGDPVAFSLTVFPAGMTVTALGLVEWTPQSSQAAATHDVALTASDGKGQTAELLWTVTVPGVAPAIVSTPPTNAVADSPYEYIIGVTGTPTPAIAVAGLSPGGWLTFDGVNRLHGTPAPSDVGSALSIDITASNGITPDATQPLSLTVLPVWSTGVISGLPGDADISSVAVDAQDNVHLTYRIGSSGLYTLHYATNATASGQWEIQDITASGEYVTRSSMALDSNGKVHVAYSSYTGSAASMAVLSYATNKGAAPGIWDIQLVDGRPKTESVRIALDANDGIHIAYSWRVGAASLGKHSVWYSTETGTTPGAWNNQEVHSNPSWDLASDSTSLSLALDTNMNVHIGYYNRTQQQLHYANMTFGAWQRNIVDTKQGVADARYNIGQYVSVALDSGGHPHFCYKAQTSAQTSKLMYATNVSGGWDPTVRDSTASIGQRAILSDRNDTLYIIYPTGTELACMTKRVGASVWDSVVVDNPGSVNQVLAAMNQANGRIYAVYSDYINNDLKYARKN